MKMKTRFLSALCSFSWLAVVHADLSEVGLVDWATFSLDVDGDGLADFAGSTSNNQNIALTSVVDGNPFTVQNFPGALPGQGTVGTANTFPSIAALQADPIYAGGVSLNPTVLGALHFTEGLPVVFNANASTPVVAGWRFGTAGTGDEPLSVLGFVLDAGEFFNSGGTSAIKLYARKFGALLPGDPAIPVSLATILDPDDGTPGGGVLATSVEFTGPKTGNISVASQAGKTYRLYRTTDLSQPGEVIDTQSGTGGNLVFGFADSASPSPAAYFYVTES